MPPSSGLWRPGGNDSCGVMPWWEGGKRDPDSCATRKPLPSTCRGSWEGVPTLHRGQRQGLESSVLSAPVLCP